MLLFSGTSNPKLAESIADEVSARFGKIEHLRFSDGEIGMRITDSFLRKHVYAVQSGGDNVNDSLIELLLMIDAFRRGAAKSVTAVIPYLPYSRKEKKDTRQDPISGKLVANLLQTAGIDALISVDLHSDAIEGFFDVPVVNISPVALFARHLRKIDLANTVIVTPDMGGAKRARSFARELEVPVVILEKIRPHNSPETEVMTMIGDVSSKEAVIVDDIISTGGTLINAAELIRERGAKKIHVCITHPLLCDNAVARIEASSIDTLFVTDTVAIPKEKLSKKIKVISIASLIATEIQNLIPGN